MKERRKARQTALQVLYQMDIKGRICSEDLKQALGSLGPEEAGGVYCTEILKGVTASLADIDRLIEGYSENWTIKRMAVVDRNILRVAVFELLYCPETPYKVVIDEAVELAKKFGSESSGAFINGILDRIAKDAISKKFASAR